MGISRDDSSLPSGTMHSTWSDVWPECFRWEPIQVTTEYRQKRCEYYKWSCTLCHYGRLNKKTWLNFSSNSSLMACRSCITVFVITATLLQLGCLSAAARHGFAIEAPGSNVPCIHLRGKMVSHGSHSLTHPVSWLHEGGMFIGDVGMQRLGFANLSLAFDACEEPCRRGILWAGTVPGWSRLAGG